MSFLARLFGKGASSEAPTLTPQAFLAQRTPSSLVLDVRSAREYATGHVVDARNVDVMAPDFVQQVEALCEQKHLAPDTPVYLYCRSGSRSARATATLRKMGFPSAFNIGGLMALRAAGAQVQSGPR